MLKWKLMFTTLPYVLIIIAAKFSLGRFLGFEGVIEFGDVGMLLTGGIFLIGFMLAGTLSDYKESEKLPAEIACTLETIEETLLQAAKNRTEGNARNLRRIVLEAADRIHDWFYKKVEIDAVHRSLEKLAETIADPEVGGATPIGVRALNEVNVLRKAVTRIHVISKTGFLSSGYAILDTLTAIIIAVLMISKFKSPVAEMILVFFVPLIYIYLLRLIRDIDDPFEYDENGSRNADEVQLFPIEEYQERLRKRCG